MSIQDKANHLPRRRGSPFSASSLAAFAALASAVAAGISAFIAHQQVIEMRGSSSQTNQLIISAEQSSQAAKDSAKAAERFSAATEKMQVDMDHTTSEIQNAVKSLGASADAAARTAALQRTQVRADQRSFVVVGPPVFRRVGTNVEANVPVTVFGKAQVQIIASTSHVDFFEEKVSSEKLKVFLYDHERTAAVRHDAQVLAGGEAFPLYFNKELSAGATYYMSVWIRYKDIFGEVHNTRFCASAIEPFDRPLACSTYNSMD